MLRSRFAALLFLLTACGLACGKHQRPEPAGADASAATTGPLVTLGVRMTRAGSGEAARIIREARDRAAGRDLVVYVGAKWCEPCKRFHEAAEAGALDGDFPKLTVLEFDLDEDRDRLVDAGYSSQFVPLFVVPGADGRASSRRFEGSVKGEAAIGNITSRLRAILAN